MDPQPELDNLNLQLAIKIVKLTMKMMIRKVEKKTTRTPMRKLSMAMKKGKKTMK